MAEFGDFRYAARFRDVIRKIVANEIEKLRPQARYASVYGSIDRVNRTCQILYAGDSTPVTVRMGDVQPYTSGSGVIVRVEGPQGARYIAEVTIGKVFVDTGP